MLKWISCLRSFQSSDALIVCNASKFDIFFIAIDSNDCAFYPCRGTPFSRSKQGGIT